MIGRRAGDLRREVGISQGDVALAARRHGLPWKQSSIATLEAGQRDLSAAELAILPLALAEAFGRRVTLADLIDPDEEVRLTSRVTGSGRSVLNVYGAKNVGVFMVGGVGTLASGNVGTIYGGIVEGPKGSMAVFGMVPTEAEVKAARKLKVPPLLVAETAHNLWRCSLTERRDQMVAERTDAGTDPDRLRALRGRVTRALVNEVEQAIRLSGAEAKSEDQD
ncbi:hypothetical protein [Frankia sp. KB5]|uniref:helix-turn-helix domain-containing protein n=1 Tax=Frankia sp. KB5 TaxID=683318 RepID=UPI0010555C25|nr:hypothetical protein [Frankia sp. KB5]